MNRITFFATIEAARLLDFILLADLAFGLGRREVAAREIEGWLKSVKSERS